MKQILLTFPTSPAHPWLHKQVVFASWRLLADKRYAVKAIIPTHNPFENNLHHCVNDFLAGDYDFWLSIDADNPPMNNPLDLVEFDRDVIAVLRRFGTMIREARRRVNGRFTGMRMTT
jgi:hypothetical protein